jgi:translation elongation factor EF-Ts
LVKSHKDESIAALDKYLDCLYNTTNKFLTDKGELNEALFDSEKVANFVKELIEDEGKYENVRRKIIDNDFNLSLTEVNLVALSFVFVDTRLKNYIKSFQKVREEISPLITQLTSADSNLKN